MKLRVSVRQLSGFKMGWFTKEKPFVVLRFQGQEGKTKTMQGQDVTFDETFNFDVPTPGEMQGTVNVEVYQEGKPGVKQRVGSYNVLRDVDQDPHRKHTITVILMEGKTNSAPKVGGHLV